ncbi:hypothetical protein [Treponema sp.]|uniref:hypothetical protein n=1 Tax=Treponema sp. TaxID=166 RepID=UPI0025E5C099|nr:hypothetical protein [Treponema sp.]
MITTQKIRMIVNISMTILSVILMGGTVLFPNDKVHQILGMALIFLWALHIALNRRWYASVGRGRYNPYRIMQTVINLSIPSLYNPACRKRNDDGVVRPRNGQRSPRLRTDSTPGKFPLVLCLYVRPFGNACRDDCK